MAKVVLLLREDSRYDDQPDAVYDFPQTYLKAVQEAVEDWCVYYEPVRAGRRGYFAAVKIDRVIPKPGTEGRYLALMVPGTFLPFDRDVPRLIDGRPLESALADADGSIAIGGAVQRAVRRLPEAEFARIVDLGLPGDLERIEAMRYDPPAPGLEETALPFERPVIERLTRRAYREVAFRRKVREAYGFRCAMSGLELRNGGGRPEVQAAHIRPVADQGSDSVRNGLALSGTLHWMFDRGLVTVAEDCETILVSRNKVPDDVTARLLPADCKLIRPRDPRDAPHPANLRWHREMVFGRAPSGDAAPWEAR